MCNCNKITICTEFDAAQIAGLQVPIASIHAFATQTVPDGYLICDGSAVSRTEYADLFAALGTVWGEGDGSTTFNIPDLRGEFLRGFDAGRGVDIGRVFGFSQNDQVIEHYHLEGYATNNVSHPATFGSEVAGATRQTTDGTGHEYVDHAKTSGARSGEEAIGASETRPRNVAVTYAIKASQPVAA